MKIDVKPSPATDWQPDRVLRDSAKKFSAKYIHNTYTLISLIKTVAQAY